MNLTWKRTLRTASSERFLAQRDGVDLAAVDLHHLGNSSVAGTVILLNGSGLDDPASIQALLAGSGIGDRGSGVGVGVGRRAAGVDIRLSPPPASRPC
jgi:hypothetical protein